METEIEEKAKAVIRARDFMFCGICGKEHETGEVNCANACTIRATGGAITSGACQNGHVFIWPGESDQPLPDGYPCACGMIFFKKTKG